MAERSGCCTLVRLQQDTVTEEFMISQVREEAQGI